MNLKDKIARVDNFPHEGIVFRDITPLMQDGEAYAYATAQMREFALQVNAQFIVGPEARGFIFGCPVATDLKIGFAPVRKPGKLPRNVIFQEYSLEYGTNVLCMHSDAIVPGQRVLIVDDLLATGGTVKATIELIEQMGGIVVGCVFLIELLSLDGRKVLEGYNVHSLVKYD